jgi:hypothetical protein
MLYDLIREIFRYADRLDPQQWLLVLVVVIIIGAICMRGLGSRSNY